jgi:hypothetical protein
MRHIRFVGGSERPICCARFLIDEVNSSLVMEPYPTECVSTLLVNYLEILLASDGVVLGTHGVIPERARWRRTKQNPSPRERSLMRIPTDAIEPGSCVRITDTLWDTFFNGDSSWLLVGSEAEQHHRVECVEGMVLGIDSQGELRQIWIHLA